MLGHVHVCSYIDMCERLMIKAGPHMNQSKSWDTATKTLRLSKIRTSWDVRYPYKEIPNVQGIFSDLLDCPIENMEALKCMRYQQGELFNVHHDAGSVVRPNGEDCCPVPYAARCITLFAYLNDCKEGGETEFVNCNLKVKPKRGLGVIHFPAFLPTAPELPTQTKEERPLPRRNVRSPQDSRSARE